MRCFVRLYVRIVSLALLIALVLSLSSCELIKSLKKQTTIYIATDIHLFSNNLIGEDNEIYHKDRFVSDGRIQEYDYELFGALIDEVNKEKPEFLVLTGDLTFNGEEDSHLEVARLLGDVGEDTKVLVIPGNHDVCSVDAVTVEKDVIEPIEGIDADRFREIYSDFGYSGAYSYDKSSLSYIYELDDNTWALMLDTNLSEFNEEQGYNIVSGFVDDETMLWLEENLAIAKEKGISVVSFTHHNLLVHNELFKTSYTVGNYEALLEIYAEYGVKLNFSGHLHIQSIESAEIGGTEIYDVSSGSLLDYGNRYGVLDIYGGRYSYESRLLDLSGYEEDIRAHSFEVFCKKYYNKTLWMYQGSLGKERGEEAMELLSQINSYYFDGSYEEINRLRENNPKLIEDIIGSTESYDTSYVKSIIEVEDRDQHKLVIKR